MNVNRILAPGSYASPGPPADRKGSCSAPQRGKTGKPFQFGDVWVDHKIAVFQIPWKSTYSLKFTISTGHPLGSGMKEWSFSWLYWGFIRSFPTKGLPTHIWYGKTTISTAFPDFWTINSMFESMNFRLSRFGGIWLFVQRNAYISKLRVLIEEHRVYVNPACFRSLFNYFQSPHNCGSISLYDKTTSSIP